MFDKNNVAILNAYISNNTITANSANRIFYLKVKPNTTYAITKYKSYYFTVGCVNKIPEIGDTITNIQSGPDNYRYDGSKGFLIYTTDATAQYIVCRFYQTSLDTGVSLNDMLGSIQVEVNSTATDYVEHKSQTFTFPLGNEKLMLGDYLADDGIHHVREQIELTEDNIDLVYEYTNPVWNNIPFVRIRKLNLGMEVSYYSVCIFNTYHKITVASEVESGAFSYNFDMHNIYIFDERFTDLATARQLLIGTVIEYELAEEVITPYTSAQQEVYNQIKQALSYEEQTNIRGSSGGSSPIFTVIAFRDADLAIASLDNRVTLLED